MVSLCNIGGKRWRNPAIIDQDHTAGSVQFDLQSTRSTKAVWKTAIYGVNSLLFTYQIAI